MIRNQSWIMDLNTFLEEARHKPFERGQHDCALLAVDAIKAMTGVDFGKEYRGKYVSKGGANDIIKKFGNKDMLALATEKLGKRYRNINLASRGDIVAVKFGDEIALAVIDLTGRRAVTTGKDGLMYYKMEYWLAAWKV